ncbi:MAG: hypothetical protein IPM17_12550 [Verrucomicrobia bacterium]|jgi:hypothetical protein|nr:hypothetical protein [Verrucomicrobiota bacterium]
MLFHSSVNGLSHQNRRNAPVNSRMDMYGRWGAIASNGTVTWGGQIFRITTESFPPVYPGTLAANRDPGHYDPVWPPGLPDSFINLHWWYSWFAPPPENPQDPQEWEAAFNCTSNTYAKWLSEHNRRSRPNRRPV